MKKMPPIESLTRKYKITKGLGFYTYCNDLVEAFLVVSEELEKVPGDRITIETVYFEGEKEQNAIPFNDRRI